jgi:hypothetical protein
MSDKNPKDGSFEPKEALPHEVAKLMTEILQRSSMGTPDPNPVCISPNPCSGGRGAADDLGSLNPDPIKVPTSKEGGHSK